jgi:NADH-quinone oxidoreductase subunit L
MGGLSKHMRITQITFLIGCLAISGVPGLSGFFSKDAILAETFAHSPIMYAFAIGAAMMTAFYMFRLYFLTFTGSFRGTEEQHHHLHESPAAMTLPLIVLAILSIVGGYVGLPKVMSEYNALEHFLEPVVKNFGVVSLSHTTEWMLMGVSVAIAVIMIIAAKVVYKQPNFAPATGLAKVMEEKWYVDELYANIVVKPLQGLSSLLEQFAERLGIDWVVNGVGRLVKWGGERMRLLQSGQVGFYIFIMVIGMVALFTLSFFWIK